MTETPHTAFDDVDRLLALANPIDVDDVPDASSPAAEALYARLSARANGGSGQQRRRRRLLVAAFAAGLLLATGAAVAAVTVAPWWQDADPPVNPEVVDRQLTAPKEESFPPTADRSRARTVAKANGAALVAAPVGETGYCLIPSLPGSPDLGFSCVYQVKDPEKGTSDDLRSYARPAAAGTPRWIIYGRVTDPRAAALDLTPAAGFPFTVALQPGGFFLADIPESRWAALANKAGPGKIVDASGNTLRRGCVNWAPSPTDPAAGRSRFGFWHDGSGPCRPLPPPVFQTPDVGRAEKLVELTLEEKFSIWDKGTKVAVWRAPTDQGGECVYLAEASPPVADGSPRDARTMPGGGGCSAGPRPAPEFSGTFATSFSWTHHDDGYGVLVQGQVDPGTPIVKVALRSATAEIAIPFDNGFYLAQLPSSSASGELPPGGPYTLVGYDASGREVASQDLAALLKKLRPR